MKKKVLLLFALLAVFSIGVQAQVVGANERPWLKKKTSSSIDKSIGQYLRFEAGFPNYFTVAYGYQITRSCMIGAGVGLGEITYDHIYDEYDAYSYNDEYSHTITKGFGMPLYAEAIFSTPKYNMSLFLDLKIGYNIGLENHHINYINGAYTWGYDDFLKGRKLYASANLGFGYKNFGIFAGASTNSTFVVVSAGVSYNLSLKIR